MLGQSHDERANACAEAWPSQDFASRWRPEVESALQRWLPHPPECPVALSDAMRYAVGTRGKRIRPLLALAAADAVVSCHGGCDATRSTTLRQVLPAACAAEFIHTQSLVHDDLPAMDDDPVRRGQPAVHVQFGEGPAVLAGDALLAEAFALLAREPRLAEVRLVTRKLRVIATFGEAVGPLGMAGGQALDLHLTGGGHGGAAVSPSIDVLTDVHLRKTGRLFRAAAGAGGIMAGGSDTEVAALMTFAERLGLAYQIVDDILDVEGSADVLGRPPGGDARAGKPTFPALVGVARSRQLATDTVTAALTDLRDAGLASAPLERPAQALLARLD